MICPSCGSNVAEARFCEHCGMPLSFNQPYSTDYEQPGSLDAPIEENPLSDQDILDADVSAPNDNEEPVVQDAPAGFQPIQFEAVQEALREVAEELDLPYQGEGGAQADAAIGENPQLEGASDDAPGTAEDALEVAEEVEPAISLREDPPVPAEDPTAEPAIEPLPEREVLPAIEPASNPTIEEEPAAPSLEAEAPAAEEPSAEKPEEGGIDAFNIHPVFVPSLHAEAAGQAEAASQAEAAGKGEITGGAARPEVSLGAELSGGLETGAFQASGFGAPERVNGANLDKEAVSQPNAIPSVQLEPEVQDSLPEPDLEVAGLQAEAPAQQLVDLETVEIIAKQMAEQMAKQVARQMAISLGKVPADQGAVSEENEPDFESYFDFGDDGPAEPEEDFDYDVGIPRGKHAASISDSEEATQAAFAQEDAAQAANAQADFVAPVAAGLAAGAAASAVAGAMASAESPIGLDVQPTYSGEAAGVVAPTVDTAFTSAVAGTQMPQGFYQQQQYTDLPYQDVALDQVGLMAEGSVPMGLSQQAVPDYDIPVAPAQQAGAGYTVPVATPAQAQAAQQVAQQAGGAVMPQATQQVVQQANQVSQAYSVPQAQVASQVAQPGQSAQAGLVFPQAISQDNQVASSQAQFSQLAQSAQQSAQQPQQQFAQQFQQQPQQKVQQFAGMPFGQPLVQTPQRQTVEQLSPAAQQARYDQLVQSTLPLQQIQPAVQPVEQGAQAEPTASAEQPVSALAGATAQPAIGDAGQKSAVRRPEAARSFEPAPESVVPTKTLGIIGGILVVIIALLALVFLGIMPMMNESNQSAGQNSPAAASAGSPVAEQASDSSDSASSEGVSAESESPESDESEPLDISDMRLYDSSYNPTLYALCELSGKDLQKLLDNCGFEWEPALTGWSAPDGSYFQVSNADENLSQDQIDELPEGASESAVVYSLVTEGYSTPLGALTEEAGDVVVKELFNKFDDIVFAIVYGPNKEQHLVYVTETAENEQTFLMFNEKAIAEGLFTDTVGVDAGSSIDEVWKVISGIQD